MADRRDTLKIIGAVGATCAFPFSADELYGQHQHPDAAAALQPANPSFFQPEEFVLVKAFAELIIPATDTPGAIAAGVPMYIDTVVNSNAEWKKLFRDGLAWLAGKGFTRMPEAEQIALLKPLIGAADKWDSRAPAAMEVRFARAFKSMTADGYYTSKSGLVDGLGYKGNTVMSQFPECIHEH